MKSTSKIKMHKLATLMLSLAMVVGLLSITTLTARAAQTVPPDWYFLVVIVKNTDIPYEENGVSKHYTESMTIDEINMIRRRAAEAGAYMTKLGVMQAHVDIVEIDEPITTLTATNLQDGHETWWVGPDGIQSLLDGKNLQTNQYDHVFGCIKLLNLPDALLVGKGQPIQEYVGLTGETFENGTGYSLIRNCFNAGEFNFSDWDSTGLYVHEFLHFIEQQGRRWGFEFDEHKTGNMYEDQGRKYSTPEKLDAWKNLYTDILLNRADGEYGTGVAPFIWNYSPRALRNTTELIIPEGMTVIENNTFKNMDNLTHVTFPQSLVSIGDYTFDKYATDKNLVIDSLPEGLIYIGNCAFRATEFTASIPASVRTIKGGAFSQCAGLQELVFPEGLSTIEDYIADRTPSLKHIYIPASVTQIGYAAFYDSAVDEIYFGGSQAQWNAIEIDDYNDPLKNAVIHFNVDSSSVPLFQ